jgi:hypothetical protein
MFKGRCLQPAYGGLSPPSGSFLQVKSKREKVKKMSPLTANSFLFAVGFNTPPQTCLRACGG